MPCFNAAETLAEAVDSIRTQTLQDWELIILDDGSSDASPRIAADYQAADARIRCRAIPHQGIVAALQHACEEARGDLIARMDADDAAHPERLERQVAFMQAHPDVALCGTQVHAFGKRLRQGRARYERWINGLVSHEQMLRDLFVECPIPHPTFMLRRSDFAEVGGYQDHGWPEDYDLVMRLFLNEKRFGKIPEPLLQWRESPERLSRVDQRYSPEQFRALKRHYLLASYLKGRDTFYQWGAGEVGKAWLREWGGRNPVAVVDINPRKIGHAIHGVKVIPPEELPAPGKVFIVVAVGAPGARAEIRAWFGPRNYRELKDYLFLA